MSTLSHVLDDLFSDFDRALNEHPFQLTQREIGSVVQVMHGVARLSVLPGVELDEIIHFADDRLGLAFNLDRDEIGVVLLDDAARIRAGSEVRRTGRVLDVPVGNTLLGRVVDALGRPLDDLGPISSFQRRPFERDAPPIMNRAPVSKPLQTGVKVIDALVPIGRGQRELILGDRQTGKSAIALDTIVHQQDSGVLCVYCSIGQRSSSLAKFIAELRQQGAMDHTLVVVADADDPPGLQYVAPYVATTMAEFFMEQGRDVLIVYDDLTRHARAYRELSLLLRRPPGREAFPGDVFYLHSRLLERSTHLREEFGGGSLTALPIVETEAQNISAYIPTNLISITDGQIYLSPDLFHAGVLPAVDVGRSVSRVGGNAQLPAYRSVAGDLRLSYAQFTELEVFSRFSTQLDEQTRHVLERGRRVREILKQPQYQPIGAAEQIAVLLAVTTGVLDGTPTTAMGNAEAAIRSAISTRLREQLARLSTGEPMDDQIKNAILEAARSAVAAMESTIHGDA